MAGWQDDPVVSSPAAASGGGWQNDPIVGKGATASAPQEQHGALYNTLFKEGAGGTAYQSADEGIFPALRDYALAGADDLTLGGLKTIAPKSVGDMIVQAHSNLGPMGYVEGAAAYGLGPGKVLAPIAKGLAGAGVAGMATEGALAGGGSTIAGGDVSPWDVAKGAAGGAALGGAAGLAGKGIQKLGATPGSIDPAAAVADTTAATQKTYASGKQIPIQPTHADNAFDNVMKSLDPSEATGMSDGLNSKIKTIRNAINDQGVQGNQLNANQIDSWRRQVYEAASTPIDGKVAAQIGDNLGGVLDASGASSWNTAAKAAYQQQANAETLQKLSQRAAAGAPLGDVPLTQANAPWNQNNPDVQKAWMDLYKQGQNQQDPSWALGHMASHLAGTVGGMLLGFPGEFLGELAGYTMVKPAIKGTYKGMRQNATQKAVQQSYPTLTGQQLTGAQSGPQTGEMIKNLMLGGAY